MSAEATISESEKSPAVLTVALVLSLLAHLALMFSLSRCSFSTFADSAAKARKWTRDVPRMHVARHAGDPMAEDALMRPRPAAAPVVEDLSERLSRLTGEPGSALKLPQAPALEAPDNLPELPSADLRAFEKVDVLDYPARADDAPVRAVAPEAEAPNSRFAAAAPLPLAVPPSSVPVDAKTSEALALFSGERSSLPAPATFGGADAHASLGIDLAGKAILQAAEAVAAPKSEKIASVQPAQVIDAVLPKVDEVVVAAEKAAVKKLRDSSKAKSIKENVDAQLACWLDPKRRDFKYFRLRLSSSKRRPLEVVPKDVVYLLDASGSIGNDRLKACRKAVKEAVRTLNSDDRFNIVAFRDRFTYLFKTWRGVDASGLGAADRWLNNLAAHGRTDVFGTLRSVLAVPRSSARALIAMVITDGEATSGLTRSAEIISAFSELNDGLVAVYMYGVKESANAYLMDMLTHSSRGEWVRHSGYRWRAAAGIEEFAARFASPVLTDIAISFAAASRVEAHPRRPVHLYASRPIDIYGVCPAATKRLVFSLKGLNGKQACGDVFSLSFDSALKADEKLRDEWARRHLYALVDQYSQNPDSSLMRDIKLFSRHYNVPIPYENELNKTKQ